MQEVTNLCGASQFKHVKMSAHVFCAFFFLSHICTSNCFATQLHRANDWLYVIDNLTSTVLEEIRVSSFDIVVIDYESDQGELTSQQVSTIKDSGKVVLAYMSIGEAEDYRFYWDSTWVDGGISDPDRPVWLGPTNPEFQGNYKVRYWDASWQSKILGTTSGDNRSYLDRIIDQGFDGVYLDIIDAFEYWSDDQSEVTRAQARSEMMNFVQLIATYARTTRGQIGFHVIPQNGASIILDDNDQFDGEGQTYVSEVDGIGVEDVFYDETFRGPGQLGEELEYRKQVLQKYLDASKFVIAVDYVWNESSPMSASNIARYNDFQELCIAENYLPYAAVSDRDLNELNTLVADDELDFNQPKTNSPLYVDSTSTVVETGSITHPFTTVGSALSRCAESGTINILPGSYCEIFTHNTAVILTAISQTAIIGCEDASMDDLGIHGDSGYQSRVTAIVAK
ncbi:MAG TPA: hypothetical protein EYN96_06025 [Candidatus Hydrogenedentes bacterium]|nr:hypothetical protein [Candidatus Hydrogenedentota bacterium]